MNNVDGNELYLIDTSYRGETIPLSISLEMFDKDTATEFLSRSAENQRKFNDAHLYRLTQAMNNGEYQEGILEPIFVSNTNCLLNGHHRLKALSDADNVRLRFLVVRGLPDGAYGYFDQNKSRTVLDTVKSKGWKNADKVSPALKFLYTLVERLPGSPSPANAVIIYMTEDHPRIEGIAAKAQKMRQETHIMQNVYIILYYLYTENWGRKAQDFFTDLQQGGDFMQFSRHPITKLKRKLQEEWQREEKHLPSKLSVNGPPPGKENLQLSWIHQAFHAYLKNDNLKTFEESAWKMHLNETTHLARKIAPIRYRWDAKREGWIRSYDGEGWIRTYDE